MKALISGGLLAVAITLGGWSWAIGWWPFANEAPPAVPAKRPSNFVGHKSPRDLLQSALQRLHGEALEHFHADPTNGYARMPIVYEKVLKDWQVTWFSLGELDEEVPVPFQTDMERIHAASVNDFVAAQPSPEEKKAAEVLSWTTVVSNWDKNKKVWEAKNVDLVGLLKHPQPVVYVSEKNPDPHDNCEPVIRQLDEFETGGLIALEKGNNLFARSRNGVIRLMGAIRAREDCIGCHMAKKEGDLLGALSYTLRSAEYARVPFRKAAAPDRQHSSEK